MNRMPARWLLIVGYCIGMRSRAAIASVDCAARWSRYCNKFWALSAYIEGQVVAALDALAMRFVTLSTHVDSAA